ncbi:MAG: CHAT domain-containing protein [Chlorobiota bacterium]|nr:MAG: CHAT domain-containing protein [Chlorobiota bacterium]
MSKSEALQHAKLKLIKNPKYAFPYFWAPFIMVGDYR